MNFKNILLLLSIFLFSLSCDETMLPKDCLGVENGTATIDDCGVCDSDPNNDNLFPATQLDDPSTPDINEFIIGCMDCTGTIGGVVWFDECNICGGDNTTCLGCDGIINSGTFLDDCGVCDGGNASMDYCGVCSGDNSSCSDCSGIPNGPATIGCQVGGGSGCCGGNSGIDCSVVDSCDVCDGDNSSCEPIIDCFDVTASNFYCHLKPTECWAYSYCIDDLTPDDDICNNFDFSGLNLNDVCCNNTSVSESCHPDCIISDGVNSIFSNPFIDSEECFYQDYEQVDSNGFPLITDGCNGINYSESTPIEDVIIANPKFGLAENNGLCEYYGCNDIDAPNYDNSATSCEDGTDSCCNYNNYLEIKNIDTENKTFGIYMSNEVPVGGFQMDFINVDLTGASGGTAAEANFSVSADNVTVIGFSFTGATIPAGTNVLTNISYSTNNSLCINSIAMSDITGAALSFTIHHNSLCSE